MRKIITGMIYDTQKSEEVGYAVFSTPSDFYHYEETLYRTSRGRFFIAGDGGALSHWGVPTSGGMGGSEGIIPLSDWEALEWCEQHDVDIDVITKYFSIEEA